MTNSFFTKDQHWIEKWNQFHISQERGSHLQLSHWLDSYSSYGFSYEIFIVEENGEILGGFGAVIAHFLFFKFYIVSNGPVLKVDDDEQLNNLVQKVKDRAKEIGCCYAHVNLPFFLSNSVTINHGYNSVLPLKALNDATKGIKFKFVYTPDGLNWVDFNKFQNDDEFLDSLKTNVRRDIKASQRKGMEFRMITNENGLKEIYNFFKFNADTSGYSIRSWSDFNPTILKLMQECKTVFMAVYLNGVIKGSIMLVWGGNFYTYMLGASSKEKPDLLTGEFLQWEAIKYSRSIKASGYNISLGGSTGVQNFKSKFVTNKELFQNGQHYWIFRPFMFKIYLFLDTFFRKNKKKISILLKFLNKIKP